MDESIYLDNLDEYIFDENRIVTYRWLSLTLSVHANVAKQMLYHFVDEQRKKKDAKVLTVIYLVSGWKNNEDGGKSMHVLLVKEKELEKAKAMFDIFLGCHVYSVQMTAIEDASVLNMADYDIINSKMKESPRYSAISCPHVKERDVQASLNLPPVKIVETKPAEKKPAPESKPTTSAKPTNDKKPGIAGMFAKASAKAAKEEKSEEVAKKTTPTTEKNNKKNSKQNKSSKGIAQMFAKQATKVKTKEPIDVEADKDKNQDDKTGERNGRIETNESPKEKTSVLSAKPDSENSSKEIKSSSKQPSKPPPKKKGKRNASASKDNKSSNKRRRIKMISDSEEEEDENSEPESPIPEPVEEEESVPVISSTPLASSAPSETAPVNSSGKRKRQKKLVSKTFLDKEGFMVTEKVYETCSESASEGEEEVVPPTPEPAQKKKADVKVKTSPAKTKHQASLTNFFTRK